MRTNKLAGFGFGNGTQVVASDPVVSEAKKIRAEAKAKLDQLGYKPETSDLVQYGFKFRPEVAAKLGLMALDAGYSTPSGYPRINKFLEAEIQKLIDASPIPVPQRAE